jgi:spore cortex biosynthesis protein YabQ
VSLEVQFLTMGLMLASGVGIGILFDLYRVLAHELRFPKWLIPLIDLAYWAVATLFVFKVLMIGNFGQVRLFVFLGLFAGYTLYFLVLSRPSVRLIRFLIRIVENIVRFAIRSVELCIIKPILFLYKLVLILLGFVTTVAMFLGKVVVQLLYPLRFLLRLLGRAIRPYWRVPDWLKKPWRSFRKWLKR